MYAMSEMQSDVLLNSCDVCDVERMDDESEGGCSDAPMSLIMLDEKAKKSIFEGGERSISPKREQKNVQKVSPYPGKVLLNSNDVLT